MKLNDLEFALMNNRVRAWSQRALETPLLIGPRRALRGKRVLEVGCGRGVGVEILLEEMGAAEVVGFDLDPKMVTLAQERIARFGEQALVYVGDAEHIAEPDASFDVVVEYGILHHIPNWRGALAEISRVLKPGGTFYFEDLLKGFINALGMYQLFNHPHATQFTGAEFRAALAEAGLQLDDNWRQVGEIGLMGRCLRQTTARRIVAPKSGGVNKRIAQPTMLRTKAGIGEDFALPLRVHTWYGVNAEVRAAGADCDIVVEGMAFPHPSLVNRFIRRGLPIQERVYLGAWHEVGHVQTLPFAALFSLAQLLAIARRPHPLRGKVGVVLLGTNALWELLSETYVAANTRAEYHRAYPRPTANLAAFWLGMAALVVMSQWLVLREPRVRTPRGRSRAVTRGLNSVSVTARER